MALQLDTVSLNTKDITIGIEELVPAFSSLPATPAVHWVFLDIRLTFNVAATTRLLHFVVGNTSLASLYFEFDMSLTTLANPETAYFSVGPFAFIAGGGLELNIWSDLLTDTDVDGVFNLYSVDPEYYRDRVAAAGSPLAGSETALLKAAATETKLLKYVQLTCRSDEAIETDNATELAAINADEGSGAGTFLNETDALEGLRDRGDRAWLTGGASGATKSKVTDNWVRTVGDNDGGAGSDTNTVNGTYFATGETNAGTFLEVDAIFTLDSPTETALVLDFWGFYAGGGAHSMQVQALDTVDSLYEPIGSIGLGSIVQKHEFDLSPNHTNASTGTVTIKFLHVGTGNPSHVFNVDKAQVNSSVPSTTAAKLLSYVQLITRSDAAIETDNATELGEINTNEGSGAGDFSSQTDSTEAIRDVAPHGTAMRGTDSAALAAVWTEARAGALTDWINGGRLDLLLDAIPTTAMRGTDNAALASVCTEGRLAELDAANLPTDVAAIPTTAMRGTDSAATAAVWTAARAGALTDWIDGGRLDLLLDAIKVITDALTAAAAAKLALSAGAIVTGVAEAGTLSITQMTTDLTEATDDHYIGRILIWTSGVLKDQATDITDYAGANGLLTYTATTEAPTAADSFVIV